MKLALFGIFCDILKTNDFKTDGNPADSQGSEKSLWTYSKELNFRWEEFSCKLKTTEQQQSIKKK